MTGITSVGFNWPSLRSQASSQGTQLVHLRENGVSCYKDLHLCSATHLEVVHVDLEVVHVVFGHVQQNVQAEPGELLSAAAVHEYPGSKRSSVHKQ